MLTLQHASVQRGCCQDVSGRQLEKLSELHCCVTLQLPVSAAVAEPPCTQSQQANGCLLSHSNCTPHPAGNTQTAALVVYNCWGCEVAKAEVCICECLQQYTAAAHSSPLS